MNTGIGCHDPAAVAIREHLASPIQPTPALVRWWLWLPLSSGTSALGVERCLSSMAGSAHALDGASKLPSSATASTWST
jgi:hypothetical protein